LAFPSGFRKSKPDVVTLHRERASSEVHLVEAKLLHIRAFAFQETVNQLDNHRRYADKLWAAFPESQWQNAAANHDRWKHDLRERGYGLLLVNGNKVRSDFGAGSNSKVVPTCKAELLESLLGPQDWPVSVPSLGSDAGRAAARSIARVVELMAGPVKELLAPKGKVTPFLTPGYCDSEDAWYLFGEVWKGNRFVQGDPFGRTLDDGRAVIWVWHYFGDFDENESAIRMTTAKQQPEDTLFYVEGEEDYYCSPISELDIDQLKANGFVFEFCLGRAIPVDDRTQAAVKKDLSRLLLWEKQIKHKS